MILSIILFRHWYKRFVGSGSNEQQFGDDDRIIFLFCFVLFCKGLMSLSTQEGYLSDGAT